MKFSCRLIRSALLLSFFSQFLCFAGIEFANPDLNSTDELLYTAEHKVSGGFSYRTVFKAKIEDGKSVENSQILTCFPESMELLNNNSVMQIRNRYGNALYNFSTASLRYLEKASGVPLFAARPIPVSVSPDGNWLCYVNKTSVSSGELVLQNSKTRESVILNTESSFDYETTPVKWSPDSSTVLYEKAGRIYFANPEAFFKNVQIDEKFRSICKGSINSVQFTRTQQLVYIDSDIVYCLNVSELYTLGLYASYVGSGTAVARLPISFKPSRDKFFLNDDASQILIIENNQSISLYGIDLKHFDFVNVIYSRPFMDSSFSVFNMEVIWPAGKNVTPILQAELLSINSGLKVYKAYTVSNNLTEVLSIPSSSYAISKSGSYIAYYSGNSVNVYSTSSWKRISNLPSENVACLLWRDDSVLYVGGTEIVREWNVGAGTYKNLFLASAQKAVWNEENKLIQAKTSSASFVYDENRNVWSTDTKFEFPVRSTLQNGRYRVYLTESKNQKYDNALYIRSLSGKAFTWALFSESVENIPSPKKVALVFDALDCATGLSRILATLNTCKIQSTFFFNGEFIRRYPEETKQIANNGFECASMFYTNADLTQKGFVIDEDFIRRGLARNEDDFYDCTGKELSLFWHAPYYRITPIIRQAGFKAGYSYVNASGGSKDAIVLENLSTEYKSADKIIEEYMTELASGKPIASIIPISVGVSHGTRADYLYEKLDLLINLLLDAGYEIVPISGLL